MVHGHASMLLECLRPYPLGAKIYKELRGLMLVTDMNHSWCTRLNYCWALLHSLRI